MTITIGVIGAGNMGSSIIGGLIADGHPANKLIVSDPSVEKLLTLQQRFQVKTTVDNVLVVQSATIVMLAIKPQHFAAVLPRLREAVQAYKPAIVSIAAGIREMQIQHWLDNQKIAIIRAMPNTPALIGCGIAALYANQYVTLDQRCMAENILQSVGHVVWLKDESLMDVVTALSGCGPAYFFLIMDALQTAAHQLGLPLETAHLLTLQTALGSARMALESEKSLAELITQVTSPGGATEKALAILETAKIRDLFKTALQAAKSRSEELANL